MPKVPLIGSRNREVKGIRKKTIDCVCNPQFVYSPISSSSNPIAIYGRQKFTPWYEMSGILCSKRTNQKWMKGVVCESWKCGDLPSLADRLDTAPALATCSLTSFSRMKISGSCDCRRESGMFTNAIFYLQKISFSSHWGELEGLGQVKYPNILKFKNSKFEHYP